MISQQSIEQVKATAITFDVVNHLHPLKKVGVDWVALCPFHNEKSPSFKVSKTKGIYKCFGCGASGDSIEFLMKTKNIVYIDAIKWLAEFYKITLEEEVPIDKRVYKRPEMPKDALSKKWIDWFAARGISYDTLLKMKVSQVNEWMPVAKGITDTVCFNYFRNGELINIKYRADNKDFKLAKDAELIFYNLDAIKGHNYIVITEGEIDALSVYQSGITSVISVPNGAAKGNQKLDYLNNCWELIKDCSQIVILADNDEPGNLLRDELARRFGYEKCFKVVYPSGCKDANDILVKFGADTLKKVIADAVEFPIEGVFEIGELYEDVKRYYEHGYPKGIRLGIAGFDDYLQFMQGQFTTITGTPGSGKSEFTDYLMTAAAKNHDWSFAICSFENQPSSLHVTKLMEKLTHKSFAQRYDDGSRINHYEFDSSINFISNHFYFININKIDVTLQGILDKAKELIIRKGIKGLLIDPWNYIEHKSAPGQTETQYISDCLTKIKSFCLTHGVHIFLVAHPTKMPKVNGKYEVPTLYNISGSAHFFNKTDNGITVSRDFDNNNVDIYIQKVRYSWLGKVGMMSFTYNTELRQYYPLNVPDTKEEISPPDNPHAGIRKEIHKPDPPLPF